MDEQTFFGLMISSLIVLVGFIISIVTPIIKLNTTITKLNETIKYLTEDEKIQEGRIEEHSKRIESLNDSVINHEVRIHHLEVKS